MDSVTNDAMEAGVVEKHDDSFTKVKSKKSQKRKLEAPDMDTEGPVASKRPQFPPISLDKLRVLKIALRLKCLKCLEGVKM